MLWKPTLLLASAVCFHCSAADTTGTKVQFSGTVIDPPSCTLNNGKLIEVPFGTVGLSQADGKKISKTVNHQLKCTGSDARKTLKMQLSGTQDFADDVLATSTEGLGIRFYRNGQPVTLKQWFTLPAPAGSMVLTASPIVAPGTEPQPGDFQASATLMVSYQ